MDFPLACGKVLPGPPHFYDIGAQLSLLMFADVAKDITEKDINLPNTLGATWNYKEARQIVINRMNYLLGMNRWGLSMVVGVGDKNITTIAPL